MSGVRDIVKGFAVFTAVFALSEIATKKKTILEAKKSYDANMARLDNIEKKLGEISAKLR